MDRTSPSSSSSGDLGHPSFWSWWTVSGSAKLEQVCFSKLSIFPHQGDGWMYIHPLWKPTWRSPPPFPSRTVDDVPLSRGQTSGRQRTLRVLQTVSDAEPGAKEISAGSAAGALGAKLGFYTRLIALLNKLEYFYFSPCQGLFCTRTVMKFVTFLR